jgi:low affinity Fe/Cu permease
MEKNKKIDSEIIQKRENFLEHLAFGVAKSLGSTGSLIVHTFLFVGIFSLYWFGSSVEQILLILTTIVSLEAIYMSIFIQMTVNRHSEGLSAVQEDIEDIQEDVEDISEDIEGIQTEVKEIGEDVDDISEDIDEISDEIVEDENDKNHHSAMNEKLQKIEETLHRLLADIEGLKK